MLPLAVPWTSVADRGEKSNPCMRLGQFLLDDEVLLTFDAPLHAAALGERGVTVAGAPQKVTPFLGGDDGGAL